MGVALLHHILVLHREVAWCRKRDWHAPLALIVVALDAIQGDYTTKTNKSGPISNERLHNIF